jgi:DNA-binding CsgD family transcriptional regulator
LAAADTYATLLAERPHRPALPPAEAARSLRAQARSGRLDPDAVEAVLVAAGQRPRRRRTAVCGLTAREVEVLGLLAHGRSNREIAAALQLSGKTVGHHVESIYAKAQVTTRAGATMFALQHGLVSEPAPAPRPKMGRSPHVSPGGVTEPEDNIPSLRRKP